MPQKGARWVTQVEKHRSTESPWPLPGLAISTSYPPAHEEVWDCSEQGTCQGRMHRSEDPTLPGLPARSGTEDRRYKDLQWDASLCGLRMHRRLQSEEDHTIRGKRTKGLRTSELEGGPKNRRREYQRIGGGSSG